MATFRGTFDYSLDAKNRLTVPAKWRASFSEGVVLAQGGTAPCLTVWSPSRFEAYTESLVAGLHEADPKRDKVDRYWQANSHDIELDAAGRIMIPARLMRHGALTKEVVVTGRGSRLEIWDREAWDTYNAAIDIDELTAQIVEQARTPPSA